MQFLYPSFLWALLVIAVPIIIHLFHFRRFKRIYFTNVHLLREIKEETSSRNKLRDLLILLARILAFSMLVFAFAQPILTDREQNGPQDRSVAVFIDNSFSMNATKDEVPLLTMAKDKAIELISSYDETDEFLVLTHDLETKHQRLVDRKTALDFVDLIQTTPNVENLENVLALGQRITSQRDELASHIYLISDFQRNISQFSSPMDSTAEINLVPIRAIQENNLSIEDCSFEAPVPMLGIPNEIVVKIANNGTQEESVQLSLVWEDQERPQGTLNIAPGTHKYDTISLTVNEPGWHQFELKIDDYPVQFDDHFYSAFEIKEEINILNIFESVSNSYLESAFESISYYQLSQVRRQNVRYDEFNEKELIILDDLIDLSSGLIAELRTFVADGGNLLVFPSVNANPEAYNSLLDQLGTDRLELISDRIKNVASLNSEEFIFKDVFINERNNIRMPVSKVNYNLSKVQSRNRDELLNYRDGSPYLIKRSSGKGNVYLCSAPMDEDLNDLVLNAEIFVPMLYKMSISSGTKKPLFYTIGEDDFVEFQNIQSTNSGNYLVRGEDEFIPGIRQQGRANFLDLTDQIQTDGIYGLYLEEEEMGRLAFNYNRLESDIRFGDLEQIEASIGKNVRVLNELALADMSTYVLEKNRGIRLWRWCLILALLFLFAETMLLRFWK